MELNKTFIENVCIGIVKDEALTLRRNLRKYTEASNPRSKTFALKGIKKSIDFFLNDFDNYPFNMDGEWIAKQLVEEFDLNYNDVKEKCYGRNA